MQKSNSMNNTAMIPQFSLNWTLDGGNALKH